MSSTSASPQSFGSQSSLLLFEISSLEGWPSAMYLGVDSVGVDLAPQLGYSWPTAVYFVAWVILGGFVVLNVFVGVLIDTFSKSETEQRFKGICSIFTSRTGSSYWSDSYFVIFYFYENFRTCSNYLIFS